MLNVKLGSICDICTDPYSPTKVPMALSCGHILCEDCLLAISSDSIRCPMCRETQHDYAVRLSIKFDGNNLDTSQPSSTTIPIQPSNLSGIEQEAERHKANIISNFNTGIKACGTVNLINELTRFLDAHPRNQFHDLQLLLQMLNYKRDVCLAQFRAMESANRAKDELRVQVGKFDRLKDAHDRLERDLTHVCVANEMMVRDKRNMIFENKELLRKNQELRALVLELRAELNPLPAWGPAFEPAQRPQ